MKRTTAHKRPNHKEKENKKKNRNKKETNASQSRERKQKAKAGSKATALEPKKPKQGAKRPPLNSKSRVQSALEQRGVKRSTDFDEKKGKLFERSEFFALPAKSVRSSLGATGGGFSFLLPFFFLK